MKKYKLDKTKKFIAILAATSTVAASASLVETRRKNEEINKNTTGTIGYEDIDLLTNDITKRVTSNNFVLLDIGSHNTDGTCFLKEKLDYCKKNNIDVGLILTTNAKTLSDVDLDIDWARSILKDCEINYPIYIDINKIITNQNFTYYEARKLLWAFYDKREENRLYIGIYNNVKPSKLKPESFHEDNITKQSFIANDRIMYTCLVGPEIINYDIFGRPIFCDRKNKKQYIQEQQLNQYVIPEKYNFEIDNSDFKYFFPDNFSDTEINLKNNLKSPLIRSSHFSTSPTQSSQNIQKKRLRKK